MSGSTLLPAAVSRSYGTFSDADFQRILNMVKVMYVDLLNSLYNPTGNPSFVPTNTQLYNTWVQEWINHSIVREQQFSMTVTTQPPVTIGP